MSKETIRNHITNLVRCKNRFFASEGNLKAIKYIEGRLRRYGYTPERDYFYYGLKKMYNLIGKIDSGNVKNYIICAHFDSIAKQDNRLVDNSPGADDNASGVAVLLDLARLLKKQKLGINLIFVFFNAEEIGRIGSQHFVKTLINSKTKIEGVINIDTIGTWDGLISKGLPVNYVTNANSKKLLKKLKKDFLLPLKSSKKVWRDDHLSFWEEDFMAIELTESGTSEYIHTPDDTEEKIHYENLFEIVKCLENFFVKLE